MIFNRRKIKRLEEEKELLECMICAGGKIIRKKEDMLKKVLIAHHEGKLEVELKEEGISFTMGEPKEEEEALTEEEELVNIKGNFKIEGSCGFAVPIKEHLKIMKKYADFIEYGKSEDEKTICIRMKGKYGGIPKDVILTKEEKGV